MTTTSTSSIKTESFSANADPKGRAVFVVMRGNADMAVHALVKGLLDSLEEAMRTGKATEVVFDVGELYFMNSSCLSLLLRFINGVVELRGATQYRVRFRSNPNLRWQKKSLAALRAYAEDIVVVE